MDILLYLFISLACLIAYFACLYKLYNPKQDDFLAFFEVPGIVLVIIISLVIGLVALNKVLDILTFKYPFITISLIVALAFFILRKKPKIRKKKSKKLKS